jgi:glycosyltransferase involved in cell wall biosynthesis
MYGGVDSAFSPNAQRGGFVNKSDGDVIIGYAGNTRKWQGIDFLSSSFARLHREDSSFKLAILSGETKGLPQGEGVQVVSGIPHNDVPRFLAECDILVIPRLLNRVSRLGAPSKLFEYLAMGKPVVVAALGDMDTIVHDGENGRTFPPGDEGAFIRTLKELKDPAVRALLGQQATNTIREHFDWDKEIAILSEKLTRLALRGG